MKAYKQRRVFLTLILAMACLLAGCGSPLPVAETRQAEVLQATLADWEEDSLTVVTEEGEYTFAVTEKQLEMEQGLRAGYPVEIYYSGSVGQEDFKLLQAKVKDFSDCTPARQAHHLRLVMTLEEKVGQMFMAHWPGDGAQWLADEYHLGAYLLFGKDFKEKMPHEVTEELGDFQRSREIPLLMAVDEEGGIVNRVSRHPQYREEPFASPQEIMANGGLERAKAETVEKCRLLSELKINLNLAPVCDISQNPDDYIYSRTVGKGAEETAEYISAVVAAAEGSGVGSCLKHFPGYGGNADTHTGMVVDNRSYSEFVENDFIPFAAGIEAGAGSVMVSHNIVTCMDDQRPASLSPEVHRVLREELGFEGVIITDDLTMDGIRHYTGNSEAAVAAVLAGNDLLCCSDIAAQVPAVLQAVKEGEIEVQSIDQSVERILRWKIELGIIQ
ncbi:MAG: beta-hexosaminidase [Oscillospiraceae bacterium]|nr:beta-hexosaminidase [Oscillospiraceae bacterium]